MKGINFEAILPKPGNPPLIIKYNSLGENYNAILG